MQPGWDVGKYRAMGWWYYLFRFTLWKALVWIREFWDILEKERESIQLYEKATAPGSSTGVFNPVDWHHLQLCDWKNYVCEKFRYRYLTIKISSRSWKQWTVCNVLAWRINAYHTKIKFFLIWVDELSPTLERIIPEQWILQFIRKKEKSLFRWNRMSGCNHVEKFWWSYGRKCDYSWRWQVTRQCC